MKTTGLALCVVLLLAGSAFGSCSLRGGGTPTVLDVQLEIQVVLGVATCPSGAICDLTDDGVVDVVDVQLLVHVALGLVPCPIGGGGAASACALWEATRAQSSEGTWSGEVAGCVAGDVSADGRANALLRVNMYRELAGLPAVQTDPTRDQLAQAAALMMHANHDLCHSPPSSWSCYTSDGALAAGKSNLATTPGVRAVDLYMDDFGNETTLGHRRWILSNSLGPIGLGSTDGYSAMWVLSGSGSAGAPWVAFPSPGAFPYDAMQTLWWSSVDSSGWSVQSDSIDLAGAQVTVTSGGQTLPVTVAQLRGGYGSRYAISFVPDGWSSQPDTTYSVQVTGISTPIRYDVEMVTCP